MPPTKFMAVCTIIAKVRCDARSSTGSTCDMWSKRSEPSARSSVLPDGEVDPAGRIYLGSVFWSNLFLESASGIADTATERQPEIAVVTIIGPGVPSARNP